MAERGSELHVIRILGFQNHYQVLGVLTNASNKEIVNAYKKWARLVHPDKNDAPQADDAMKKVAKAREILTDPTKRRLYDQLLTGRENPEQPNQQEDDDDDDDELFNTQNRNDDDPNWWNNQLRIYLLVCLPVILLLLIPATVDLLKPCPVYSLSWNAKFPIRKRTMGAGKIPYYVTKDFRTELQKYYDGSLGDLERDVKYSYQTKLMRACESEKRYKRYMLDAALNSPDKRYWYERVVQAKSIETPSCEKLRSLADVLNQPNYYVSKIWKYLTSS